MENPSTTIDNGDSILDSVKKLLGAVEEDHNFDVDILTYINGAFLDLQQIGAGPEEGYTIYSNEETWLDFSKDALLLASIKPYIYLKVKLIFDSASLSSSVTASLEKIIERFEWRINMAVELAKGKEG